MAATRYKRTALGTALNSNYMQVWEHENIMRNHYRRLIGIKPKLDNVLYSGRNISKRSPANLKYRRRVTRNRLENKKRRERAINEHAKKALGKDWNAHALPPRVPGKPRRKKKNSMAGPFRRRRKMKRMAHLGGGKTSKRKKKGSQSPRPGWNDSVYGIGNKYPTHRSNIESTFGVHMKWDELINNPGKWSSMLDDSEHMCYQEQSKRRNLKKKKGRSNKQEFVMANELQRQLRGENKTYGEPRDLASATVLCPPR